MQVDRSPSSTSLHSFTPGPHRRSHPNLQQLSVSPLTPRYPVDPSDFDAYIDPLTSNLHTSLSFSHFAGSSSPGRVPSISSTPNRSRSNSQVRMNGRLKRKKHSPGLSLSSTQQRTSGNSTPSGALTSAGYGGVLLSPEVRAASTLKTSSSTPWLVQTGLALTDSSRESKGQSWMAKRGSSTGLDSPSISSPLRTPNEELSSFSFVSGSETQRTSRGSGRNTPTGARSRRGSRSRICSRRDLTMTPAAAAAGIIHDSKSKKGGHVTATSDEDKQRRYGPQANDVPGGARPEWVDEATQAEAREDRNREMIEEMDRAELLGEDWDPDLDDVGVFEYDDTADGPDGLRREDEREIRRQVKTRGFFVGRWFDEAIDSLLRFEDGLDEIPIDPPSPVKEKQDVLDKSKEGDKFQGPSKDTSRHIEISETAHSDDVPHQPSSTWEDVRWFGRVLWDTATS